MRLILFFASSGLFISPFSWAQSSDVIVQVVATALSIPDPPRCTGAPRHEPSYSCEGTTSYLGDFSSSHISCSPQQNFSASGQQLACDEGRLATGVRRAMRTPKVHYSVVKSDHALYLLSCSELYLWSKRCPLTAVGAKYQFTIEKSDVRLQDAVSGNSMKLEYVSSVALPLPSTEPDHSSNVSSRETSQAPPANGVQSKVTSDPEWQTSQPAVFALRTIAIAVKECSRQMAFEMENTNGPLARAQVFQGPPRNVLWDVTHNGSVRSPFTGYIEFSIPQQLSVPPDVMQKWSNEAADLYAKMVATPQPTLKYRYEFDLGPDGLQLTRTLLRSEDQTEWKDAPTKIETCWQRAAQSGQITSRR